jgi:ABC-type uncharacterized transport system auxiliary subunit
MMARRLAAAILLAGAAGCVTLARPAPPMHEYRLDYAPPESGGDPLPIIVRLTRFRAADLYAKNEIIYRDESHRVGSYAYHRWASDPASMISSLLARDLAASGEYRAVLRGPSVVRSDYQLDAEIEAIEERTGAGCTAHVALRALLLRTRGPDGPVLFQRPYEADEACGSDDAPGLVAALSRAVAAVSGELRRDVRTAIAADLADAARETRSEERGADGARSGAGS